MALTYMLCAFYSSSGYNSRSITVDKLERRGLSSMHSASFTPGKDVEADVILALDEAYKLLSDSNKTERFGYKGEWANVQRQNLKG